MADTATKSATKFSWKRSQALSRKRAAAFDEGELIDHSNEPYERDWRALKKRMEPFLSLEDASTKSKRLKGEGVILAEQERYWEAVNRWDEAIALTPNDEILYEMKSQVLLELCELFPAVRMAEKALGLNPRWWTAYQTLGRAQLGFGDVEMAVRSFGKAIHIKPDEKELWEEDIQWARSLRDKKRQCESERERLLNEQRAAVSSQQYPVFDEEGLETENNANLINQSIERTD